MSQYQFDHEWQKERERLANMEAVFDPMTAQCLESIGVREGWKCLEVGSGGGSIVEWLSKPVGSTDKVIGTDLQIKFLEAIDAPNVEVRQHNILTDDLEQDAFSLVCARKVLEHLADPPSVLQRMVAAVANMLRATGLADVQLRGWTGEWTAAEGNPTGAVYRLKFEKMRERMTEGDAITNEVADQFLTDIQSPEFHAVTGIHFAAWGRKPSG